MSEINWASVGIDIGTYRHGKTLCPKCSASRKKPREPILDVDLKTGMYHCKNGGCGFQGKIFSSETKNYFNDFKKTVYQKPIPKYSDLTEKTIEWFRKREVTLGTLKHFQIKESQEWMYEKIDSKGFKHEGGKRNCINFPYYRGDDLINIKYRDALKCFKLVKEAELIFYNLNAIKDERKVVIVEGEIDCLSMYEAGVLNCVSVPNGASGGSELKYLDNCYEYFEGIEEIIIATDDDAAGHLLKDELLRRFGNEKCSYVDFKGLKDANDFLVKFGKEELKKVVENAIKYPIEGMLRVDDFTDEIMQYYHNGYPKGHKVGFKEFDELMSWAESELTIVTGIPSSGKSNFIDQVCILLSLNYGWKFAIFSPESNPAIHTSKMCAQYVGKSFNGYGKMSQEELDKALQFYYEFYHFYNYEKMDMNIDSILEKARQSIFRYGINAIVLDPYNNIEHHIGKGETETQYINTFLSKLRLFKNRHRVHIILVAHPTKIKKDEVTGKFKVPTLYDISGSANFYNKADNGITVYRDMQTNVVSVFVQKIRFSHRGKIGVANFDFDRPSFRYKEEGNTEFITPIEIMFETREEPKQELENHPFG